MLHRGKIQLPLHCPPMPGHPGSPSALYLCTPTESLCIRAYQSISRATTQTYMTYTLLSALLFLLFSLELVPHLYYGTAHSSKASIVPRSFVWALVDLSRCLLVHRHPGCSQFRLLYTMRMSCVYTSSRTGVGICRMNSEKWNCLVEGTYVLNFQVATRRGCISLHLHHVCER